MALQTDVVIVGGGPGGLAAAHSILRARPSAKVLVMERSRMQPRGASLGISPNGMRALEAISPDLKEQVMQLDTPMPQLRVFNAATGELESSTVAQNGSSSFSKAAKYGDMPHVAWHDLQAMLAATLPPDVLRLQHRFVRFSELADGGLLTEFEGPDGSTTLVESELLVGADGGQSLVREQLLGDGPPSYMGSAIWRAIVSRPDDWPVAQGAVRYSVPNSGTTVLAMTLPDNRVAWQAFTPWPKERLAEIGGGRRAYISPDAEPQSTSSSGSGQEKAATAGPAAASSSAAQRHARVTKAFETFPSAVREVIAGTEPSTIAEHGQFFRDPAACDTWGRGRVTLLGDAAHLATPFLGQGSAQAFEDALELGRAIGERGLTAEALRQYELVRRPQNKPVHEVSVQMFRDFVAGRPFQKTEVDYNIDLGFIKRTFEPLACFETAHA